MNRNQDLAVAFFIQSERKEIPVCEMQKKVTALD